MKWKLTLLLLAPLFATGAMTTAQQDAPKPPSQPVAPRPSIDVAPPHSIRPGEDAPRPDNDSTPPPLPGVDPAPVGDPFVVQPTSPSSIPSVADLIEPGPASPAAPRPPVPPRAPNAAGFYSPLYGPGTAMVGYQFEPADGSQAVAQLVQRLAAAKTDSERETIKGQLTQTLAAQFEKRQKRHEAEIAALEDQVKKLRDLVEKRKENRRDIILRRLDQILKDSQGLGW